MVKKRNRRPASKTPTIASMFPNKKHKALKRGRDTLVDIWYYSVSSEPKMAVVRKDYERQQRGESPLINPWERRLRSYGVTRSRREAEKKLRQAVRDVGRNRAHLFNIKAKIVRPAGYWRYG